MLIITKGYVQALLFVFKTTFTFLWQMEVCCFELQIKQNLLLGQSAAVCFTQVQLKQSFSFESISRRYSTLFTESHGLPLWPYSTHAWEVRLFVFSLLFEKHLPFYVFDHCFCQSTFLMSPLDYKVPFLPVIIKPNHVCSYTRQFVQS